MKTNFWKVRGYYAYNLYVPALENETIEEFSKIFFDISNPDFIRGNLAVSTFYRERAYTIEGSEIDGNAPVTKTKPTVEKSKLDKDNLPF